MAKVISKTLTLPEYINMLRLQIEQFEIVCRKKPEMLPEYMADCEWQATFIIWLRMHGPDIKEVDR